MSWRFGTRVWWRVRPIILNFISSKTAPQTTGGSIVVSWSVWDPALLVSIFDGLVAAPRHATPPDRWLEFLRENTALGGRLITSSGSGLYLPPSQTRGGQGLRMYQGSNMNVKSIREILVKWLAIDDYICLWYIRLLGYFCLIIIVLLIGLYLLQTDGHSTNFVAHLSWWWDQNWRYDQNIDARR